jgi:MarR family transcriptional regulator, organic hydroperoxide resistance regulator
MMGFVTDSAFHTSDAYEISGLMFQIVGQMTQYFELAAAEYGLSEPQARLMLELDGPTKMSVLATRLGCDASNVTGLVDRMAGHGFVARRQGEDDRRVRLVELTNDGKLILEQLQARFASDRPSVLALRPQERAELLRLLRRVHELESSRLEGAIDHRGL